MSQNKLTLNDWLVSIGTLMVIFVSIAGLILLSQRLLGKTGQDLNQQVRSLNK